MSEFRLEDGAKAPGFSLPNQDGKKISFSAFKGKKTIVYFYPAALTPGCSKEAADFEEALPELATAGYTVIGISPDKVEKLKKFQAAEGLHFELLSDIDLETHKAWGAFGEKSLYGRIYKGVIRSTFIVNEKGIIEQALYNVRATNHMKMLKGKLGL